MFKRFIIAGIAATMILMMFTACGVTEPKELWTYSQKFETNDVGEIVYSVHTFYSDNSEYARRMATKYQYHYLDKGRTVTELVEINKTDGVYYQFKVVAE